MIVGTIGGTIDAMVLSAGLLFVLLAPPGGASSPEATASAPVPPSLPEAPAVPEAPETPVGPTTSDPSEPTSPEPVATPEPVVTPEPVAPPEPAATGPEPMPEPIPAPGYDAETIGADTAWMRDYVKVERPRYQGTGMIIGASISFGIAVLTQAVDSLACGDCGTGIAERLFLGTAIGLAAGAGINRARAEAYDDTVFARKRPRTGGLLVGGAVLTGVGVTLGLANEGLWWRCVFEQEGPYTREPDPNDFSTFNCRYGLTRGLLDLGAGATAAGLGMLSYALTYRRHARAYERARVVEVRPNLSRQLAGLSIGGRF